MVDLGWRAEHAEAMAPLAARGLVEGRVAVQQRGAYTLWSRDGEIDAVAKRALERTDAGFPVIGDWVAYVPQRKASDRARIEAVLPRLTKLSRKGGGVRAEGQGVAANVDSVFVMMGLDDDFNLRRLERFLIVVWESGAEPVIVLNKVDLAADANDAVAAASGVAPGVPVVAVGSKPRAGLEQLDRWLEPGR